MYRKTNCEILDPAIGVDSEDVNAGKFDSTKSLTIILELLLLLLLLLVVVVVLTVTIIKVSVSIVFSFEQ